MGDVRTTADRVRLAEKARSVEYFYRQSYRVPAGDARLEWLRERWQGEWSAALLVTVWMMGKSGGPLSAWAPKRQP